MRARKVSVQQSTRLSGNHLESLSASLLLKVDLPSKSLSYNRLELISSHMVTNLLVNVKNALDHLPAPKIYAWLDSTVALHWILGNGRYKQFVSTRVSKMHQLPEIHWRHVPTSENPADLCSEQRC